MTALFNKNLKKLFQANDSTPNQRLYFVGLQGVLALFFITPFAVMRFLNAEYLKGIIDLIIVAGMFLVSIYVMYGNGKKFLNPLTYFFSAIYTIGSAVVFYFGDSYSVMWTYPAAISCYFVLHSRHAIYYSVSLLFALAFIGFLKLGTLELIIVLSNYIATCTLAFILSIQIAHDRKMIENYTFYDVLTGAKTRNLLINDLQEAIAEHDKNETPHLSIIIFDIDHFKNINDKKGHSIGDHVLKQVTEVTNSQLSLDQNIYRYGGEEFFVLLKMNAHKALDLAERMRVEAENANYISGLKATISLGVAEHKLDERLESLTQRADKALYASKEGGRNRSTLAT